MGLAAVDSNVIVRYFARDDQRLLQKAQAIVDDSPDSSLYLDRIIAAEVGYVLRSVYGFDRSQIILAYRAILGSGVFVVESRSVMELAINLFASEKPLSFEDCWLMALKRMGKVKDVHTFDEPLRKRLSQ